MADRSKSGMGGKEPHGEGTRTAEYIETPLRIGCGTCEYLTGKKLCRQEVVLKDRQIPTCKETGLKIVDPVRGCCRFWDGEKDKD